jgi:hypothetical protein
VRADQVEGGAPRRDPGRPADHHGRGQPSAWPLALRELVALREVLPGRRTAIAPGRRPVVRRGGYAAAAAWSSGPYAMQFGQYGIGVSPTS